MGTMDGGGSNNATQTAYRFRRDDGDESYWNEGAGTGASYHRPLNTAIEVPENSNMGIRVRICVESSAETLQFALQRKVNAGSWFQINTTDTAVRPGASNEFTAGNTTDLTGTAEDLTATTWCGDSINGCLLEYPYYGTNDVTFGNGQDTRIEIEMMLDLQWSYPLAEGDQITIRAVAAGVILSGGYTHLATIDIVGPGEEWLPVQPRNTVLNRVLTR